MYELRLKSKGLKHYIFLIFFFFVDYFVMKSTKMSTTCFQHIKIIAGCFCTEDQFHVKKRECNRLALKQIKSNDKKG